MRDNTESWLKDFIQQRCLVAGEKKTLSSGKETDIYFDCKKATLNGEFLSHFAKWSLTITQGVSFNAVGGPTLGADCMIAAMIIEAHKSGLPHTYGLITRKNQKQYGTQATIENDTKEPRQVLVVEDVITTGKSVATSCDHLKNAGHSIAAIMALVDREAGGVEMLKKAYNVPVLSLSTLSDFV